METREFLTLMKRSFGIGVLLRESIDLRFRGLKVPSVLGTIRVLTVVDIVKGETEKTFVVKLLKEILADCRRSSTVWSFTATPPMSTISVYTWPLAELSSP